MRRLRARDLQLAARSVRVLGVRPRLVFVVVLLFAGVSAVPAWLLRLHNNLLPGVRRWLLCSSFGFQPVYRLPRLELLHHDRCNQHGCLQALPDRRLRLPRVHHLFPVCPGDAACVCVLFAIMMILPVDSTI